jgi:transcription elongation factor Elf1
MITCPKCGTVFPWFGNTDFAGTTAFIECKNVECGYHFEMTTGELMAVSD